ncbi:hypothetical protein ACT0HV_000562 [Vibrio diabolicus]
MGFYKILISGDIVVPIELNLETSDLEIEQLENQGFEVCSRIFDASSKNLALDLFYESHKKFAQFTIKDILLFKTSALRPSHFILFNLILFIFVLLVALALSSIIMKLMSFESLLNDRYSSNMAFVSILVILLVLFNFWASIALMIGRWKNCGRSIRQFVVIFSLSLIFDVYLSLLVGLPLTVFNCVLFIYLLFKSPAYLPPSHSKLKIET